MLVHSACHARIRVISGWKMKLAFPILNANRIDRIDIYFEASLNYCTEFLKN